MQSPLVLDPSFKFTDKTIKLVLDGNSVVVGIDFEIIHSISKKDIPYTVKYMANYNSTIEDLPTTILNRLISYIITEIVTKDLVSKNIVLNSLHLKDDMDMWIVYMFTLSTRGQMLLNSELDNLIKEYANNN